MEPAARPRRPRFPLLAPLVVLGVLASLLATPVVDRVAHVSTSKPFCLVDTDIPDEAYAVEEFARTHNYSPPPGFRGNSTYLDTDKALPGLLAPFKEYDVCPKPTGQPRPPERVVLSPSSPYASWYSPDHYATFHFMFPPGCLILPTRLFR